MLRARWWPATVDRPKTAFTFAVLDRFVHLTVQSKINLYDFYMSLVHETDNTGTLALKVHSYPRIGMCLLTSSTASIQGTHPQRTTVSTFTHGETEWTWARSDGSARY